MSYHPDLENLKARFQTFTQKLLAKANELEQEVKASAQMMYDEDTDHHKRNYIQFKSGIEGQYRHMLNKARDVFDSQIRPLRDDYTYAGVQAWFSEMYTIMNGFEEKIYSIIKGLDDAVQEITAESRLQHILKEYEEIKDEFHCSQCGANLEIDQVYFVSTYITCPYCQTQNTFVPSSNMKELQFLSREVAEERLEPMERQLSQLIEGGISKERKSLAYLDYRAMLWVEKAKVIPVFKEEYAKVFYREFHDEITRYNTQELNLDPAFYLSILEHLGFKNLMKPKVIQAYETQDFDQVEEFIKEWTWLYELSSFLILKIYQGEKQKALHEKHFHRIQNEWKQMSTLHQSLKDKTQSLEEVVSIIQKEF
ncbi:hypothetical protein GO491_08815 [Flavobacteriaceae bacterium Ap0902]|nr:hypothetical protein [Flavobacteriaceae bacterium Ap0902]